MKARATVCSLIITLVGVVICDALTIVTMARPVQFMIELYINHDLEIPTSAALAINIIHPIPLMIVSGILCMSLVMLEIRAKRSNVRFLSQVSVLAAWACTVLVASGTVLSAMFRAIDELIPKG